MADAHSEGAPARDIVFLFPGQGSQSIGMGKALFDEYVAVRELFELAGDLTGKDFQRLCFEGPDSLLVRTDNVQPAITLVNLACLRVLRQEGFTPAAAAGHSLGEYAALVAAGTLSEADAIRLVQVRGEAMQEAAARHPGGMMAVFGLPRDTLTAVCAEVTAAGSVEVANHNSPLQVVLTGETGALQQAAALAKQKGAKLTIPLNVSGAWHSRYMSEAQPRLREALQQCEFAAPRLPVISNVTADLHPADPGLIRERLVEQLVRPVLWADSMRRLIDRGWRVFVEAGPGKVLAGLMRDINREATVLNMQDARALEKVRAVVSAGAA